MKPTTSAPDSASPGAAPPRTHSPALATALALMLAGTAYPRLLADAAGRADHALAMFVFWAMTAGFVRGVGFIPHHPVARWLLSGWACVFALAAAAAIRAGAVG